MIRSIYIGVMLLLSGSVLAQQDSVLVLSFDRYMQLVKDHHPVARQAALQVQLGEATLLQSKGLFDLQAFTSVAQKYYDGTQYYSKVDGGLKLPTWFGLELKSGYEQNEGVYLDPERTTPSGGLWYAGVSVPVGQGLFIDKRRAELKKARSYVNMTKTDQQIMLNDLLFAAGKVYWDWFSAYQNLEVYREALSLSQVRFEAVKQGAELGDRPFIDTLEAGIQVQNRLVGVQQTQLDFANATAMLEVYLWAEGVVPLELEDSTVPESIADIKASAADEAIAESSDSLIASHPELARYGFQLEQLEIEKQWQREQMKPTLNLNYNAIAEPVGGDLFSSYSINNYTWGLNFQMPLFLRRERGAVQMAELRIQETVLDVGLKNASLMFKASASLNEWNATKEQADVYARTVQDYAGLLEGERQLFNSGESSLFMVNARELGYINAQINQIEILAKNQKAKLSAAHAFGQLWNQ